MASTNNPFEELPERDDSTQQGKDAARLVGPRVLAAFVDLVPVIFVAVAFSDRTGPGGNQMNLEGASFLLVMAVGLGYYFVSETLTGATPGKRLLGLTVISSSGSRPGPGAVATRTVLRLIDGMPALYLLGFVVMLVSPNTQRIGDMAARTRVVRRPANPKPVGVISSPQSTDLGVLGVVLLVTLAVGLLGLVTT